MPVLMEGTRYRDAPFSGPTRHPVRPSTGQGHAHDASYTLAKPAVGYSGLKPGAEVRHRSKTELGVESRADTSPPRVPQQYREHRRATTGRVSITKSAPPGEAKMISFDPIVEVINVSSTDSNRRRRQRRATNQRDPFTSLASIPPRAPELERLSTPEIETPPPSAQSFCACCTGPGPHVHPSNRRDKLETQSMLSHPG